MIKKQTLIRSVSFRHVHSFKSSLSSESSSNSAPLQVAPIAADCVTFSDGKKTYRERWQPQNSQSAPKWRKTFQSHRSARRVNGSTLIGSRRRTKWRRGAAILGVQWRIVEQHVTFGHRLRTRHELRKPTLVINCHLDYKLDEIPTIFTTKWPTFRVDVVCLFSQSQQFKTAKIFSRRHNFRRRMDYFVVKIFNWWQRDRTTTKNVIFLVSRVSQSNEIILRIKVTTTHINWTNWRKVNSWKFLEKSCSSAPEMMTIIPTDFLRNWFRLFRKMRSLIRCSH